MEHNSTQATIGCWIGSYTSPAPHVSNARGKGIYRGCLNLETGVLDIEVASTQTRDPSYLARKGNRLAAVSEMPDEEGELHIYRIDEENRLHLEASLKTGAPHSCHLQFVGDAICIANYFGDRLQVFRKKGGQWKRSESPAYVGSGPNMHRQEAPHLHHILVLEPLGLLAVSDLGSDRIWLHGCKDGVLSTDPCGSIAVRPGSGPRHLAYDATRQCLYVLGELSGSILAYKYDDTKGWTLLAEYTLPIAETAAPSSAAIHIHPNGRFLYVSERATNRLFQYNLLPGGYLDLLAQIPTGGGTPRDFGIDPTGTWIVALNQDSHTITTFRHSETTATDQRPVMTASCGSPVCIIF